ncbi:YrzI family small protein [Alteribacter natronophilus]|nr:YrzI family small protein [Alteribacter natronophilus]
MYGDFRTDLTRMYENVVSYGSVFHNLVEVEGGDLMIFTLFHFTISIEKQPYKPSEIEKEQKYLDRCRKIDEQRNRQSEMYRIL